MADVTVGESGVLTVEETVDDWAQHMVASMDLPRAAKSAAQKGAMKVVLKGRETAEKSAVKKGVKMAALKEN